MSAATEEARWKASYLDSEHLRAEAEHKARFLRGDLYTTQCALDAERSLRKSKDTTIAHMDSLIQSLRSDALAAREFAVQASAGSDQLLANQAAYYNQELQKFKERYDKLLSQKNDLEKALKKAKEDALIVDNRRPHPPAWTSPGSPGPALQTPPGWKRNWSADWEAPYWYNEADVDQAVWSKKEIVDSRDASSSGKASSSSSGKASSAGTDNASSSGNAASSSNASSAGTDNASSSGNAASSGNASFADNASSLGNGSNASTSGKGSCGNVSSASNASSSGKASRKKPKSSDRDSSSGNPSLKKARNGGA